MRRKNREKELSEAEGGGRGRVWKEDRPFQMKDGIGLWQKHKKYPGDVAGETEAGESGI